VKIRVQCFRVLTQWRERKCDGINDLRRLTFHHPKVLLAQLHTFVLAIVAEVTKYGTDLTCSFSLKRWLVYQQISMSLLGIICHLGYRWSVLFHTLKQTWNNLHVLNVSDLCRLICNCPQKRAGVVLSESLCLFFFCKNRSKTCGQSSPCWLWRVSQTCTGVCRKTWSRLVVYVSSIKI
jgi:hypothetical protein